VTGQADDIGGDGPGDTARVFVQAVAWGEHHRVWDLLSAEGRRAVLRVATTRGMPEPLAARLRDGTADDAERDQFLGDLVNGLRADLQGTDVDALEFEVYDGLEPGAARVVLIVPVPNPLLGAGLPAASIELHLEDGGWHVDRMVPRVAK
jgi:hypothetical protein